VKREDNLIAPDNAKEAPNYNQYFMRSSLFSLRMALLICGTVLAAAVTHGQSLSIIKKADSNYWIEASAPPNDPHTLQTSENLHLWIDLQNEIQQSYSFQFNNTGVTQRYFRLLSSPPAPPPIRVVLIGDSMTADCCGWGRGIYRYFNANATVVNFAQAWASTKIFLQSPEMEKMLLVRPDYVLVQFGYMDGGYDPDRSTTLEEFAANLRTIVQTIRGFNGIPILITLHAPRLWGENGKVIPAGQDRNSITKQIAVELETPVIDLYQLTFDLFNELGPSGTAFMQWEGGTDFMHFSQLGGEYISRLIANKLPDALGPYLTGIFDPPVIP
jgi:lysophospholipase L1-like esterase